MTPIFTPTESIPLTNTVTQTAAPTYASTPQMTQTETLITIITEMTQIATETTAIIAEERAINKHTNIIIISVLVPLSIILMVCSLVAEGDDLKKKRPLFLTM